MKRLINIKVLFITLCQLSIVSYQLSVAKAQHVWTFDECVQYAINNNIDILAFAVEEEVAHPATDYVAVDAELVGFFAHELENGILYFRVCDYHEGFQRLLYISA